MRGIPRWVDGIWLALLSLYIVMGLADLPEHGDESTLIAMGDDYYQIFQNGRLDLIFYNRESVRNSKNMRLRLLNGTISKYVYGWVRASNGSPGAIGIWAQDHAEDVHEGRFSGESIMVQARRASSAQLALAVILFFCFVRLCLNRPTAYLASAFFSLHPNVLINGRRATMEGSHLLGLIMVLLAGAWLMRERTWRRYALLGACIGFAISAKHTNALPSALVFCACLAMPLRQLLRERGHNWRRLAHTLRGMLLTALMSVLVFLFFNPAWWTAPLEASGVVIELRRGLTQAYARSHGYTSLAELISGYFQLVFVGERQYVETPTMNWFDETSQQIKRYESTGLAGGLAFGESVWLGIASLALSTGAVFMLVRSRRINTEFKVLILTWVLGSALFLLFATPLPWARYYLSLAPAMVLMSAFALTELAAAIGRTISQRSGGIAALA